MLQLILGRAGYGKTEYILNKIKDTVDNNEEAILITPEQFSFIAERRLLDLLGEAGIRLVENTSFTRLNNIIDNLYGKPDLPVLSKGSKAIIMKQALEMVQDGLELYSGKINSVSFINSAVNLYDEMKSCRVSTQDIIDASEEVEKETLSRKLKDIALIIGAYDSIIDGRFYDSANELTRLYKTLTGIDYFKGKKVFIDGFSGFVAQEFKIIEVILRQASEVYITFCSDSNINSNKFDLLYYVNKNISILTGLAKDADIAILEPIYLKTNYRAQNSDLLNIEKNAFSAIKNKSDKFSGNIKICRAKSITDECDKVSKSISRLLRSGKKASDIVVICRNMDEYEKELQFSFDKFNIPYFHDERQVITSQPLIMFVNFLIRSIVYSYSSDDIFSMLKTGLTDIDNEKISRLENYVYLWNINNSKWKSKFTQSTRGYVESISDNDMKALDSVNEARSYVVDRLNKFASACKKKPCKDISRAVYNALIDFSCDKGLKELAVALDKQGKSALSEEQGRIWDLLMDILNKLAETDDGKIISLSDYYKLFNLMLLNEDLGAIPMGLDNVQIGSADRIRCDNPDVVFIVGANEGEFPKNVSASGLLCESDRMTLSNNNFKLYSYSEVLNAQEKYFAYMAMNSAKESLYISYKQGSESAEPSAIIKEVKACFSCEITDTEVIDNIVDLFESDENAFEYLCSNYTVNSQIITTLKEYFSSKENYSNRLNAVDNLSNNEEITIRDKRIAVDLFKKDMYLSASKIEDYFNCPFRYFCKFGLNARPRPKAELDSMQTGTVIHYVLEQIISEVGSKRLADFNDIELSILVKKYLNIYLTTMMGDSSEFTQRFKYQFMRLSQILTRVVLRLREEFRQSDFVSRAFELKIGDGSGNEPVISQKIMLDNGGSIMINGSIDRVDTYNNGDKQYVRVVDYKSGTKKFSLNDIMHGLNLQMFIYLFNLCKSNNELSGISSGVLYMHASRRVFNLNRNTPYSEIAKNEDKEFRMMGVVLNDAENEIAPHMQSDGKSKYIPDETITLDDFNLISSKIDELITDMGNSLHSGNISQYPINGKNHDKTCEFCDYGSVCMNRTHIKVNEIGELSKSAVLSKLKGEEQNA